MEKMCPICGKRVHGHPIVMGGQGRSDRQVTDESFWLTAFLAAAAIVLILIACLLKSGMV